jgi:hypothetical protein
MRTAQLEFSGALLGVVFVLLLLACVNVASLFSREPGTARARWPCGSRSAQVDGTSYAS